uniref:Uncharacterized protein n=1 Tax=Heterorhabditis bacteriophora TaxID=37862 RepID=A0A1I7WDS4_HETBA
MICICCTQKPVNDSQYLFHFASDFILTKVLQLITEI